MTAANVGTLWTIFLTALVVFLGIPMLVAERGLGPALLLGGFVIGFVWTLWFVVGTVLEKSVKEQVEREIERRSAGKS